ncbi:MAG: hypothetical protein LBH28_06540 [Oscillospiraceae bacterium]|nr:hypothetical protein [Oscillospiraceae bacterium]
MGKKNIVMLLMCRRAIAGQLADAIGKRKYMEAHCAYDYRRAGSFAEIRRPNIALVEIPEKFGYPAVETLDICGEIKIASPGCKVILLCPVHDKESVYICTEAKKQGEIEDFLFYNSSVENLVTKLESLLPA